MQNWRSLTRAFTTVASNDAASVVTAGRRKPTSRRKLKALEVTASSAVDKVRQRVISATANVASERLFAVDIPAEARKSVATTNPIRSPTPRTSPPASPTKLQWPSLQRNESKSEVDQLSDATKGLHHAVAGQHVEPPNLPPNIAAQLEDRFASRKQARIDSVKEAQPMARFPPPYSARRRRDQQAPLAPVKPQVGHARATILKSSSLNPKESSPDVLNPLINDKYGIDLVSWKQQPANKWEEHLRFLTHDEAPGASLKAWHFLKLMYEEHPKHSLSVTAYAYLMVSLARDSQGTEAFKLFNMMKKRRVDRTANIYTSLLNAIASNFDHPDLAHRLEAVLLTWDKEKYLPNIANCNAMLSGYSRAGLSRPALELLEKIADWNLEPNVITWSLVIKSYIRAGDTDATLEFFNQLVKMQKPLDRIIYESVISACCRGNRIESAMKLYSDAQALFGDVNSDVLAKILTLIIRCEDKDRGLAYLDQLESLAPKSKCDHNSQRELIYNAKWKSYTKPLVQRLETSRLFSKK